MKFAPPVLCVLLFAPLLLLFLSSIPLTSAALGDPFIAIDLGARHSLVAIYTGEEEHIEEQQHEESHDGMHIIAHIPSYVAFVGMQIVDGKEEEQWLVGEAAKNQAELNPENTIFDVKRLIGRRFDDKFVQKDMKLPYTVVDKDGRPYIQVQINSKPKLFSPEEISAKILSKLKEAAEEYLGKKVENVVITVPAYFTDPQRQATKDAGTIAGLNVLRIITEPIAAAIAYGLDRNGESQNILVYNLGSGIFDVSTLIIDEGFIELLATHGDIYLGGEDFDQRLMQYFLELIKQKSGINLTGNQKALDKLRREVEKAKRSLSTVQEVKVEIESLTAEGENFSETLTRAKFEELNNDLFLKTLTPLAQVLKDADLKKTDIHEIVLVGGSTRIPKIQELIKEFFNGKEPLHDNPEEVVVQGAAITAWIRDTHDEDHWDDLHHLLLTRDYHSLGFETAGGVFTKLIDEHDTVPIKKSHVFTTEVDNQSELTVHILQGESEVASENAPVGELTLTGLTPQPKGTLMIEVSLEIDDHGAVHVEAVDQATGKVLERVTLYEEDRYSHLPPEELMQLVHEAEEFAEIDREMREANPEAWQQFLEADHEGEGEVEMEESEEEGEHDAEEDQKEPPRHDEL